MITTKEPMSMVICSFSYIGHKATHCLPLCTEICMFTVTGNTGLLVKENMLANETNVHITYNMYIVAYHKSLSIELPSNKEVSSTALAHS